MPVKGLEHVNIDTCKPEETIAFYAQVLGLENRPDERPAIPFPGAWLFLDGQAVVHLNFIEEDRTGPTGAFNHVAFEASDFDGTCAALDAMGHEYRTTGIPTASLRQIFVHDPNGVMVELNIRE